jgi:hypothetical protein
MVEQHMDNINEEQKSLELLDYSEDLMVENSVALDFSNKNDQAKFRPHSASLCKFT